LSILDVATGECRLLSSFAGVEQEPETSEAAHADDGPAGDPAPVRARAASLRRNRQSMSELRALLHDTTQLAASLWDTALASRRMRTSGG
jgi:hypothetical protein